eukprot:gb/GECG01000786.1/.p1 GENE.gb/GECG01000786.1/~~gb/GECG01000786.1/.p1  ORF type:complete len:141 (+),score=3.88 gb/GECG01000786.1/:1-423(+)
MWEKKATEGRYRSLPPHSPSSPPYDERQKHYWTQSLGRKVFYYLPARGGGKGRHWSVFVFLAWVFDPLVWRHASSQHGEPPHESHSDTHLKQRLSKLENHPITTMVTRRFNKPNQPLCTSIHIPARPGMLTLQDSASFRG